MGRARRAPTPVSGARPHQPALEQVVADAPPEGVASSTKGLTRPQYAPKATGARLTGSGRQRPGSVSTG
jgi:hypothetical protein